MPSRLWGRIWKNNGLYLRVDFQHVGQCLEYSMYLDTWRKKCTYENPLQSYFLLILNKGGLKHFGTARDDVYRHPGGSSSWGREVGITGMMSLEEKKLMWRIVRLTKVKLGTLRGQNLLLQVWPEQRNHWAKRKSPSFSQIPTLSASNSKKTWMTHHSVPCAFCRGCKQAITEEEKTRSSCKAPVFSQC